jgi:hypothetical protein
MSDTTAVIASKECWEQIRDALLYKANHQERSIDRRVSAATRKDLKVSAEFLRALARSVERQAEIPESQ